VAWINVLGSYASQVVVPAAQAIPIPDSLTTAQALMFQSLTAQYLVTDYRDVRLGNRVLVHSAAGGVGQLLVHLFHREKFAHLPKAISTEGERAHTYEAGEIAYWSPGPDVAIYYRQDGEPIPPPGIIPIGKIDAGAEVFDVPGSVKVTIELAK